MSNNGAATRFCNDDVGPTAIEEVTITKDGAWTLALTACHAAHVATSLTSEKLLAEARTKKRRDPHLVAAEPHLVLQRGSVPRPRKDGLPLPNPATRNASAEPVEA